MKKLIFAGIGLVAFGAALVFGLLRGAVSPPPLNIDDGAPHLLGVDVSHHQGRIDWVALAGHDIAFAFMKATEGGDWIDPKFQDNWRAAKRAGLPRGAYHFFTLCRDAGDQAEHFLATVGNMQGALLPALDAEHMGPCRESAAMTDVAGGVLTFLDTVHGATGMRPVIYTTKEFYTAHLKGKTPGERFWLRSLITQPTYHSDDWLFWQYSGNGRRRGVNGAVDLNIFDGDQNALDALIIR